MANQFTERMCFFVFTPILFIWSSVNSLQTANHIEPQSCQTIGCPMGFFMAWLIVWLIPLLVGLKIRERRIKKEKATQQTTSDN